MASTFLTGWEKHLWEMLGVLVEPPNPLVSVS